MNAQCTGKKIAELRKAKNLTQKQLATQLYVTDKAISKWERGINFPDLGVMETLAEVLDTTPSYLLGIENEAQKEIINSLTEITSSQNEEMQKEMRQTGWLTLVLVICLELVIGFARISLPEGSSFRIDVLLVTIHGLIGLIGLRSFYILKKYEEIRSWELLDYMLAIVLFFVILFYLGFQFLTGNSPNEIASFILFAFGSISIQLLFYRTMRSHIAKALPLLFWVLFTCRAIFLYVYSPSWEHARFEQLWVDYISPTIFLFVTWLLCKRNSKKCPIK